ncbi:GntR family transcriptional regulator [Companilactobacillus paralimentarius DSM 13238 = JCM 10415]|jgi:Predicted transcriptional regulators|uniref:GntR family transcriptional regulator n=1 Tax=Companilactobacillus paralimentarius DSM 13238 = JCM 10415 TaxID=1122151 RepID=A0A0R1PI17_9LACO|nr:GntR family transcriptional regulator [Companilactobacillus paralimentarius]KAE9564472.1 GntR family transcriptional regulator [Companilactobacillus paralimentarius]KAE9565286.1 GntR family transcriptional regulator [Companilactobacillus paralimentarius]KRL31981.1 GntR family transcriptional regulator [Companilactobacillus paralimentarius DSM 13238 = JCM 10415]MDR4932709.1 GntR family transcriptional regulator [Companilactobacillus paralimentarius]QFR69270.1 GntR family transcriptional regu
MEYIENIPIYLQIKDYLEEKIITESYSLGEQMPSVRQLALELAVNSNTVQKALKVMIEEGVIITLRGKGNFVTENAAIVEELKNQIVNETFDSAYDKLHLLKMDNQEITNSFSNYVKQKEKKLE